MSQTNASVINSSVFSTTLTTPIGSLLPSNTINISPIDLDNIDWNSLSIAPASTYASANLTSNGLVVQQGNIHINDPNGDVMIGDISLKESLNRIEERLAILKPNSKLEKDWEELRELGTKYRELEKNIIDKLKVWDVLSK